jgi:hypothetical protein
MLRLVEDAREDAGMQFWDAAASGRTIEALLLQVHMPDLSMALKGLASCWLSQLVSTWQVEMGWPDIHWLARDRVGWWQPI